MPHRSQGSPALIVLSGPGPPPLPIGGSALDRTSHTDHLTPPRYRLFHQALGEALTRARDSNDDARRLWHGWQAEVLPVDERGRPDWALAPVYLRRHAGEYAAAAGELPQLLDDTGYLAVTDLARLLPLLPPGTPAGDTVAGAVLRRIGMRANPLSPVRRAQLLALTAAHLGLHDLRGRPVAARPLPVRAQWRTA